MTAANVNEVLLAPGSNEESDLVMSEFNNKFTITNCGDTDGIFGCRIMRCHSKQVTLDV